MGDASDAAAFLASIQRDLNGISDADRSTRRRAFEALTKQLFTGDASRPPPSDGTLLDIAATVIPAAARGAADAAEKVRELCIAFFSQYVKRCAGSLGLILKTLVPTLVTVMGPGSIEEPSEEIRFARATLVGDVCALTNDKRVLANFADELAEIICAATKDPFHDVKKATHRAVEAFVEGLTSSSISATGGPADDDGVISREATMKKHAGALCASVLPDARHRHSQVRLSCLRAVTSLVPFLTVKEMEELVAPGLNPMCADRTPGVRFALHQSLTKWIVESTKTFSSVDSGDVAMGDAGTAATFDDAQCALPLAPCLLPMLLTGVADETDANALAAAKAVEEAGAANDAALRRASDGENDISDEDVDGDEETEFDGSLFPHPFDGGQGLLPGPSSRKLVTALLPSLFPLAIKETREWTASKRNAGARLLGTTLIYGRDNSETSPFLPSIVNALIDAVTDDDKDTAERVLVAARAIGHYAKDPERSWIPLVADVIAGDSSATTSTKRAAALVIAAAAIRATKAARFNVTAINALADTLASNNVLTNFDDKNIIRTQCLSCAANLVDVAARSGALKDESADKTYGQIVARASASLFRVLLQTRAAESSLGNVLSNDISRDGTGGDGTGASNNSNPQNAPGALSPSSSSASASAMANLSTARGFAKVDDLYLAHANDALKSARVEAESLWDVSNPSQRAFCAFFLDAPVNVFKEGNIADEVIAVFKSAGGQNRDPSLRAAMLRAMDAAFEEPPPETVDGSFPAGNRGLALLGGVDARAVSILETVVLDSLVWRAGATAAAARYAAIVCLGTMLRRSLFLSHRRGGVLDAKESKEESKNLLVSRRALLLVLTKEHSALLPSVFSAMEEDYYAETRKAACYALDGVLATAGCDLGDERRRFIYPEILKRMDDSRDDVRVAAAKCARTFFSEACPVDWDETNCLYFLKPLFVHMDDPNESVRDAVLDTALAAAEKKPAALIEALTPARETHRHREHVDKALDAARAKLS